jgi:thermitase
MKWLALACLAAGTLRAGAHWQPGDAPGTVLVLFKPAAGRVALKERSDLHARLGGTVDLEVPAIEMHRVRVTGSVDAAIDAYLASPLVAAAEPDHPIHAAAVSLNDTHYARQWYLGQCNWTQAVLAYNNGEFTLPSTVKVAVIDSGVDAHYDLTASAQLLPGAGFVAAEPGTDDLNGHGTFCAGLIGAATGNNFGIAGAFIDSAKVQILPVKVLNSCGSGQTSDLAAGLAYAVQQGCRVLSLSIESAQASQAMESAVADAHRKGALVVVAAGNEGAGTRYPAVYPQAFAVGALDHNGQRASYGNYGKLELSAPGGDLAAPGVACVAAPNACCTWEIWSLTAAYAANSCAGGGSCGANSYEAGAGTSFAAPLVSAAAALLFSQHGTRTVEDVERILLQTALPTAYGSGYSSQVGWGKLNFQGALLYQSTPQAGAALKLYNWPNPFSPDRDGSTTLTFFLPEAAPAVLRLLDAGGDLVKQWNLDAGQTYAGMNLLRWDGRNGLGNLVANGAYAAVLESGGKRAAAGVAVLR